ncbi:hypothetical protein U1Q18_017829 [Sarracenia purpurea var. burkii]
MSFGGMMFLCLWLRHCCSRIQLWVCSIYPLVLGLLPCYFPVRDVDVLLPFGDGFVDYLVVAAVWCTFNCSFGSQVVVVVTTYLCWLLSVGCSCSSGLSIVAWVSPASVADARESPRAGAVFVVWYIVVL